VELELQIVPFLAATLYKLAGVHEVFGRLITLAFSLGTVAVIGAFARWLFAGSVAGVFAALLYAVMPGSIYYGRTFTPDATMVFFLAAALFAAARLFVEEEVWKAPAIVRVTALFALAYLAKPVAVVALVPLAAAAAVPIVPLRVEVLRRGVGEGRRLPWRGHVAIHIGAACRCPPEADAEAVVKALECAVASAGTA